MGDSLNQGAGGSEAVCSSSLTCGVQNGRKQLGEEISIVRLQVRSQVQGVIEGDITIPVAISVNLTWNQVFKILKIQIDPQKHVFRAYGQIIEDFSSPIYKLYYTYKTKRDTYYATILARDEEDDMPKTKAKSARRRKKSSQSSLNPSSSRTTSTKNSPNKRTLPNRKVKSKTATAVAPAAVSSRQKQKRSRTTKQTSKNVSLPKPANTKIQTMTNPRDHPVANPPEMNHHPEERNEQVPFRFNPSSAFVTTFPTNHPNQATLPASSREFERPELAFRDESTMAGDLLLPEETDLKPKILRYLTEHCSNRDMLSMRMEMLGLKRAMKFQALNRLIPFTAGILQNAFLD
ncbi:uncharacterized protein LOC118434992 [Folsomia candida]|uniref:uncharacterized protein LOC118434992 n=1 Tax=Folsomia candida TaxID=158441 RepID=UPI0016054B67|nr:uncharacterized protein LOC118434992 [Folsomia candida]